LRTPGISPRSDISRKQIRQIPNFRMNARGLPHRWHRLRTRTANFGGRFNLSMSAFLAIQKPLLSLLDLGSGADLHRDLTAEGHAHLAEQG
jgi:hypothetical protein